MAAAAALAVALAGCGDATPAEDVAIPTPESVEVAERGAYARPLGAAVSVEPARTDEAYLRRLTETFTSVTPENAMKWEVVHPARGRFDWARADAIVDAARAAGKRVRGHPLVWDHQLPAWVEKGDFAEQEMEQVLREHVRALVERYRGRVDAWDVINEPLEDDGSLTQNVFAQALGERYIDIAFDEARKADPDARLYLNEIAAERGRKLRALVRLVRRLEQRGVPIDGVGLQNHTTVGNPPSREDLAGAMRAFDDLGLAVEITEMDVAIPPGSDGARVLERQAAAYRAAAQACAQAANCEGLTVWGVTDAWSWLGAEKRPLPYDEQGRPKPAADALTGPLRG